ncbi:MAG: hypothetical protein AAF213_08395 [Pseudomonadota bacterium]
MSVGEVLSVTDGVVSLRLDDDGRTVDFKTPQAPNSTPLDPQLDPRVLAIILHLHPGNKVRLSWESKGGLRVPTHFDRVSPDALQDIESPPVSIDRELMAPTLLTERGGYFDLLETSDANLLVYDRINNAVSGERDLYRMYDDGRLPLCITCFVTPRPRAVLGNPGWLNNGTHVVFQRANDNADNSPSNGLAWGINHDLWVLDVENRSLAPLLTSPPNHGAGNVQTFGPQIVFSERVPSAGSSGRRVTFSSMRNNDAEGWLLRSTTFSPDRTIPPTKSDLAQERRSIAYPGNPSIAARTATDDSSIDGIYARGPAAQIWEQLVLGRVQETRLRETKHLLGPALYDGSRRVLAYSSSRMISQRALGRTVEQYPTDLFIRFMNDTTYQITQHEARDQADGNIYQILDLDWNRERSALFVAVSARNPITGREQETEIWRYDLAALLAHHQAKTQAPDHAAN